MSSLSALCLAISLPYVLGCGNELIGTLPNLEHGVSGNLYVVDDRTFCIDQFSYNGQGPDAFLYFYYPGDPLDNTGGGVYVPLAENQLQFELGRAFTDELLTITLPVGLQTCDFEGFAIWCRYASQLFTSIMWNNSVVFENIACRPSPGRGFAGSLPTLEASVSGQLYIKDNKTLVIRDFTYDGQAPDTFVYWYAPGATVDPAGGGFFIPLQAPAGVEDEEGRFGSTIYELPQDDFFITIPEDMDVFTCDIGTFTIWCREFTVFFTSIAIDGELFSNNPLEVAYSPDLIFCNRTTTRPGVLIGELPTMDPRAASGTFYVQDQDTFFIQLFSYDASREDTFLYYYPVGVSPDTTGDAGFRISFSDDSVSLPTERANSLFNSDFTVDLGRAMGGAVRACDVGYFTILDEGVGEQLTMIQIPQDIFTTGAAQDGMIMCVPDTTLPTTDAALPNTATLGIYGALAVALLSIMLGA